MEIEIKSCKINKKCEHGITKTFCKKCKGSGICEHDKFKTQCIICGHKYFCEHEKQKKYCKECCGIEICEHKKQKRQCKECNGNSNCEHGKQKSRCKECKGKGICEHEKDRRICKECIGCFICEHKKFKQNCRECGGINLCKNEWCETAGNIKYEGYCVPCFVNNPENQFKPSMRNYKTKEKEVVYKITQIFPDFTWITDKKIQDGCSRRRPDLLLDMGSHIIIVEVDENKHNNYDCSCEHKRLMELSQDLNHRPIVFIRFNPDDYTNTNGILVKSCWKLNKLGVMQITKSKQKEWEDRLESLKQQIKYWIENPTEKTIEIIELFY